MEARVLTLRTEERPRPARPLRITVIGAGHGGQAMAAHLSLMGQEVCLYNRSPEPMAALRATGGIQVEGAVQGYARLGNITSDMSEALTGADLIMVCVPASAHIWVAEACAPHLHKGQIIVLNPGRTGGALEFRNVLSATGFAPDVVVAETQTFIYASRRASPGHCRIFRIKHSVPLAALPATQTEKVIRRLKPVFPQFIPASSVLKTSLDNIGAMFHPVITILNAGRIEDTSGDFQFYLEGVTPSIARMIEAVDRERVAVAQALHVRAMSALEFLEMAYGKHAGTLYEAMRGNEAYMGLLAPRILRHRYLFEDIPTGLVPMASIGRMLGVATPNLRAMIQMASELLEADFWETGRTVEKLGIAGATVDQISHYVLEGGMPAWNRRL